MILKIQIDMDNAAFQPTNGDEVAAILRRLADKVSGQELPPDDKIRILDTNGNHVGDLTTEGQMLEQTATYTSVWDDDQEIVSGCKYNPATKRVYDIEDSDQQPSGDSLTDEYITLPDGTELREKDGIKFDYKDE